MWWRSLSLGMKDCWIKLSQIQSQKKLQRAEYTNTVMANNHWSVTTYYIYLLLLASTPLGPVEFDPNFYVKGVSSWLHDVVWFCIVFYGVEWYCTRSAGPAPQSPTHLPRDLSFIISVGEESCFRTEWMRLIWVNLFSPLQSSSPHIHLDSVSPSHLHLKIVVSLEREKNRKLCLQNGKIIGHL